MENSETAADDRSVLSTGAPFEDRYEIVGEVGTGSFGRVYRAIQRSTGQPVALKVMRRPPDDRDAASATVRQRFHREMRLCAELSHPNIVRLLDSGECPDGTLYAAFEYITGSTLQRLLEEEGKIEPAEAVHLMAQVLDALACAHRRGVVHRDIKPANIMIAQTGARRNALVLDFGLGGFAEGHRDWESPRITMTQEMVGTPAYAAPEQLRGEPTTTRSDLYSWGLVLIECLTGEPVIRGSSVQHVLHMQLGLEPIPIPDWLREHPLGALLASVTSKNPDARSKAIPELIGELDRALLVDLRREAGRTPSTRERIALDGFDETAAGQQRQVTALSCRITAHVVGSKCVAVEELDETVRDVRARCLEMSDRLGGLTVGSLGGTFQLAFGYPRAEEDAARRAVRAALEIADCVERRSREAAHRRIVLAYRIGLHTGLVVPRSGFRTDTGASALCGTTLDAASHLDAVAGANEILVSGTTYDLLRGQLTGESVAAVLLPGSSAPMSVVRLVGRQQAFLSGRVGIATTPFVGRSDEIATIERAWERVRAGTPDGLLVLGDAGMGKSRLVHELRRKMSAGTWIECHCTPEGQTSPLRALIDGLGEAVGPGTLDVFLAEHGVEPTAATARLATLLSNASDSEQADALQTPQERRKSTFDALIHVLVGLALRRPTTLVVEDLHWADPTTLDVLGALLDEMASTDDQDGARPALLVLLTARTGVTLPRRIAEQPRISLRPLSRDEAGEMVRTTAPLSPSLVDSVVRRAEGIPLFVEELTRIVAVRADGRAEPTGDDRVDLPATLRNLMMARLERLTPSARHTAQLAAALGREFAYPVLSAIVRRVPTELDRDLEELSNEGLIHRRRRGEAERYVFKHALIRDAAYDCMAAAARQRIHETIARVLRDEFPMIEAQQPETMALHFEHAGFVEDSIRYWRRAAQRAATRSANAEATVQLTRAIGLVDRLPDTRERRELEVDLQLDLGRATYGCQGFGAEGVATSFGRALELSRSLDDPSRLFWSENGLWFFHLVRGDTALTHEHARHQMELFRRTGDPIQELSSLHALGSTAFYAGDFARACEVLERATELYMGHVQAAARGEWIDPRVYAQNSAPLYWGWALLHAGFPERARALLTGSLDVARKSGSAFAVAEALNHVFAYWHDVDEPDTARPYVEECVTLCTERGFEFWRTIAVSAHGWTQVFAGAVDEGLANVRRGLIGYLASGAHTPYAYRMSYVVESLLRAGRLAEGLEEVDRVLRECPGQIDRFYDAELHRLRGELLMGLGRRGPACEAFQTALARARSHGARWLELRAATSLARWLPDGADRVVACNVLRQSIEQLAEHAQTRCLAAAREVLDGI